MRYEATDKFRVEEEIRQGNDNWLREKAFSCHCHFESPFLYPLCLDFSFQSQLLTMGKKK